MLYARNTGLTSTEIVKNENGKYECYFSGYTVDHSLHRVGIAVKVCSDIQVLNVEYYSARLMTTELKIGNFHIKVICCYAPTCDKSQEISVKLYAELLDLRAKTPKNC